VECNKQISLKKWQEKLKDKFKDFTYQAVANCRKELELKFFGKPTDDAETMHQLILNGLLKK